VSANYQRVPPLGGDRAAEFQRRDPVELRAEETARKLDALEAKGSFDDGDRYAVDAVLMRPFSTENRQRAETLKARHGVPSGQRPLFQSVQRGQQQDQDSGQSGKSRDQAQRDYEFGQRVAKRLEDAFRDADN